MRSRVVGLDERHGAIGFGHAGRIVSETQAVVAAPVPSRAGFAPEVEAQMRAEFSKAIANEGPVEALKHTEQAVVAPAQSVVDETKETAVQDVQPQKVETKVAVTDEQYDQAVKALRFAKYTTKDFEALGHDRVIALGAEHRKNQNEIDKRFEESAARVKALEEAAAAKSTERNGHDEPPKRQPEAFKAAVKLTAQAILNAEDPEDALTKFHEASTAPIRAELQESKGLMQQLVGIVFELQANSARGQLPERIRGLVDDKTFAEMLPKTRMLMASGGYTSVADALYDAVPRSLRESMDADASSAQAKKSALRENGQFSSADRRPTAKPRTDDDRTKAAIAAASMPGATEDSIRAAFNG